MKDDLEIEAPVAKERISIRMDSDLVDLLSREAKRRDSNFSRLLEAIARDWTEKHVDHKRKRA